jgi:EAL domain-containing protein (putative c-di-GMP-specific phosphodiesterase class I)
MRALGCNELQGFLLGRPVPAGEIDDDGSSDVRRRA